MYLSMDMTGSYCVCICTCCIEFTQEFITQSVHEVEKLPFLFHANIHQTPVIQTSNVHIISSLESCPAWDCFAYCLFQSRTDVDFNLNLKLDCCIRNGWLHAT